MLRNYSVSVQMRDASKTAPSMAVLANDVEGAWYVTQQIVNTIWDSACRPEGAEFYASICEPDSFDIHRRQNYNNNKGETK